MVKVRLDIVLIHFPVDIFSTLCLTYIKRCLMDSHDHSKVEHAICSGSKGEVLLSLSRKTKQT
jgi:hypothetical protein